MGVKKRIVKKEASVKYEPAILEPSVRRMWEKEKIYAAGQQKGEKKYVLVELAYSSGDLHIGHWFAWAAPDAYARFLRMKGYDVLFPVGGFDSFGLPAENAAIQHGVHPADWTNKNIENMRRQFQTMGPSFDWDKEVVTSSPEYYKWTQWLFLKFYAAGLAYKAKAPSNWCPVCQTVLANEHVVDGCCWRHRDTPVIQKDVEQWFIKITSFADKLIWPENPKVDWPEAVLQGHNSWIGRREGINIEYSVAGTEYNIKCWTSRPDTNFGATFIVLAPEHPLVLKITAQENHQNVKKYIEDAQRKQERERLIEARDKTGVFTGSYGINQLNGEKLPIWVSDFVLMTVGTGAVVGVPGHDKRDFEFAQKFGLPVKRVVVGKDGDKSPITKIEQVQEEEGTMINSEFLDGMDIHQATKKIMDYLEEKGWGKRQTVYHLRDWSVSRQRYWGAPVPIIYCEKCGVVPVPEKDLPVLLPYEVDYTPTGEPPLATAPDFVNTKCSNCGGPAKRDTETLDTYVDSSWYFLRYPNPRFDKGPFDPAVIKEWLPLEIYFGGGEHTLGHTLYARFVTKFLHEQGFLGFDEFAKKRRHHGVILGPDGYRMSKSRGNVVNPDDQVKKYGADAVRTYLCFMGPHEFGAPWSQEGIEGASRFLHRVWRLVVEQKDLILVEREDAGEVLRAQHKVVQKVTQDIEELRFNTAIAGIMEFVNVLQSKVQGKVKKADGKIRCAEWDEALKTLVLLLAPFAPHVTEELWGRLLGSSAIRQLGTKPKSPTAQKPSSRIDFRSIHFQPWPTFDPELAQEETIEIPVQVNGKLRGTVQVGRDDAEKQDIVEKQAREVVREYLAGVKKVVFVPGRLINFVV